MIFFLFLFLSFNLYSCYQQHYIQKKVLKTSHRLSPSDVQVLPNIDSISAYLTSQSKLASDFISSSSFNVIELDYTKISANVVNFIEALLVNPYTIPSWTMIVFVLIVGGLGQDDENIGSPYDAGETEYNYKIAEDFYGSRPLFVFRRLLRLSNITGAFNIKLAFDYFTKKVEENQKERAKEALELVTQLGPTFIKLGQALSIRTDLIPEPYALELRKLQDAVPPFNSNVAREIMKQEFGVKNLNSIFESITDEPIASASIGQVYKAKLFDGRECAVKVQRPKIINEIALDLYCLRLLTPFQVWLSNTINKRKTQQSDIDVALALVDEWGRGFVAEVDYRLEALNGKEFSQSMIKRGLNAVTAPDVVDEYSGSKIIVTKWMNGTRLDKDASPDVPRLCGVAVNAYLTMLLDTGVLHCDPHPGNLLRTTDGKLCILDWGMTLRVPKDLQYSLLEFIAHINTEDYDAIPNDFVNLGFSPPDKTNQLKSSGITEGLSFAFRQLRQGGGPKKMAERVKQEFKDRYGNDLSDDEIRQRARDEMVSRMERQLKDEGVDVNGVTNIMEEMSRRNRELFKLPPYVLYVSRAFSTLEGIGLSIDENYSILQECYPYLARRLFTDNSPRAKSALRTMLLGGSNVIVEPNKLLEMSQGFASYTSSTIDTDQVVGMESANEELVDLVLSSEGNTIQEILIEGISKMSDAVIRNGVYQLRNSTNGRFIENLLKVPVETSERLIPSQFRSFTDPLLLPITLPYKLSQTIIELSHKSIEDEKSLTTFNSLVNIASTSTSNMNNITLTPNDVIQQITNSNSNLRKTIQSDKLGKRAPVLLTLSRRLGSEIFKRAAHRFEEVVKQQNTNKIELKASNSILHNFEQDQLIVNIGTFASQSAMMVSKVLEIPVDSNKK